MVVRLLHISDLHYSYSNDDQANIIKSFFEDLRAQIDAEGRVDSIVFSGDIVNNPDEDGVYLYVIDNFIYKITEITGVSERSIAFCPGNHDISFSSLKKNALVRSALDANLGDVEYFSAYYERGALDDYARDLSSGFFEFCEYLNQPWSNPFFHCYDTTAGKFLCINSAFTGTLHGSAHDRGKLFFPYSALSRAIRSLDGGKVRAFVNHFPIGNFDEAHERAIVPDIRNVSEILLFGHVHDADPINQTAPDSNLVSLQSGALYARRDYFKGYSIISVEDENIRAKYRSYYDKRRIFDEATNIGKGGLFFNSKSSQTYWHNKAPEYSAEQLISFLKGSVNDYVAPKKIQAVGDQPLRDVFIFPTFSEQDLAESSETGEPKEFKRGRIDFTQSDENICLHFPDETGATSFLQYISIELALEPKAFKAPRIPLYIDVRDKKPYPSAVLSVLKAAHPLIDDPLFGWNARRDDQPYIVLVDNFSPSDPIHLEWIREAHRCLGKARFIICAKSPFATQNTSSRPAIDLPFGNRVWTLVPLNRGEVREIVRRFELPENLDKNLIVEEIISKFRVIGVPVSAPMISMYLSVLRDKKKYSPINASAVIENFIESSLNKGKSVVVYQEDFDYQEQIFVLSLCAKYYLQRNVESVPFDEMYQIIAGHYADIGVKRDVPKIIQFFCKQNLFENVGNSIFFKYNIVYSYLVAVAMKGDEGIMKFMFDDGNFYRYISEVEIYFGMNRHDVASLRKVAEHYQEIKREVEDQFGDYVDTSAASKIKLPKTDDTETFVRMISDRIEESHTSTDADRDRAVDGGMERPSSFVQRFKRPEEADTLVRWVKILAAYSVAVKNLEQLKRDEKLEHLTEVLNGWAMLTALSFQVAGFLFEKGSMKLGNVEFKFGAHRVGDPKFVRMIIANIPRYVSYYARLYSASGKLEEIFKSCDVADFADFLRTGILVDMRTDNFLGAVEKFERKYRSNSTLVEAMMWKLRDSFLRFGLAKAYVNKMRGVIASLQADILGYHGADRDRRMGALIQSLNTSKTLRDSKDK